MSSLRRRLSIAALVAGVPILVGSRAGAPHPKPCHEPSEEHAGPCVALTHYLQAHATGQRAHAEAAFFPDARMVWVAECQRRERAIADYIAGFDGTPAPDEASRERWVERLDVTGNAAVATIVLDYPGARIVDYMTLLRAGGAWRIVHKSFQATPRDAG
jgi:hypothetical protein